MQYMGSKNRISKEIIPIIQAYREKGMYWVEPFVGGGNSIDKVENPRIGSDINPWVISALISIRDNPHELPKNNSEFTEKDYKQLRSSDLYKHKGFAGFAYSYAGKWLGGWSRNKKGDDYIKIAYKNALKQSPNLKGVELIVSDYKSLPLTKKPCILYCDPPYRGTTGYNNDFNHDEFFDWCRDRFLCGDLVFVSEYSAPKDFICIWEKEINNNISKKAKHNRPTEKLFILK